MLPHLKTEQLVQLQFTFDSSLSSLLVLLYYYDHFNHLKYLTLKADHLIQAQQPGGTLTHPVKQPYSVCCLTGHMFKTVQWGNVNNMKMMSRNISSSVSLPYPDFLGGVLS